MFLYKKFLTISATLSLLVINIYSIEENPIQPTQSARTIPSLTHMCWQAYAREAAKSTNLSQYFEPLCSEDLTEEDFYGLATADPKNNGGTLLHYAAQRDFNGTMTLLDIYTQQEERFNTQRRANGIDDMYPSLKDYMELRNQTTFTALTTAFSCRQFAIADLLIASGASYETKSIIPSITPNKSFLFSSLNHAIIDNNLEWATYLISRNIPLQEAITNQVIHISNEHKDYIENLKRRGWTVMQPEEYGLPYQNERLLISPHNEDVIHTAMAQWRVNFDYDLEKKSEIIWGILDQTADNEEQNHLLHRGIQIAIAENNFDSLVALLKKAPANALNRYPDILVKMLKHNPADSADIVSSLLERGAILNVADAEGNTPLHLAVLRQNLAVVRRLVKAGAHINAINDRGDTPLNTLRSTQRTRERTQVRRYLLHEGGLEASKLRAQR